MLYIGSRLVGSININNLYVVVLDGNFDPGSQNFPFPDGQVPNPK